MTLDLEDRNMVRTPDSSNLSYISPVLIMHVANTGRKNSQSELVIRQHWNKVESKV